VTKLETGLELIRRAEYFEAHEELEDAWRAAEPEDRDFYQGLVHVAVAWYQAGRGNRVGCERQLEKAARRLGPYAPEHRGVDVASLLHVPTGCSFHPRCPLYEQGLCDTLRPELVAIDARRAAACHVVAREQAHLVAS